MILIHTGPSPHSGHKIDKFIQCPQKYAYAELIDPPPMGPREESPALIKGSLGHQGLAHYYRRLQARQRGEDETQWFEPLRAIEERAARENRDWLRWVTLAQDTVQAYVQEYDGQRLVIDSVEDNAEMLVDLSDGSSLPLTRSADLVVRVGQHYRIIDHKFVGRLTKRTVDRYSLSGQFLDYAVLGREQWGEFFDGAWINFIEWPKDGSRPRFQQVRAPAAPHAVEARRAQLSGAYMARKHLAETQVDPWNYPKRLHEQICNGPYGMCDAMELCRFGKVSAKVI